MKTWAYLIKGGKIDVMKAFLYHILNNLIIDHTVTQDDLSRCSLEKALTPALTIPLRILDAFDGKGRITDDSPLPENTNRIMRMKYVQLLSIKEISI